MKNLAIVAQGKNTARAMREQLHRLIGNRVNIGSYAIDEHIPESIDSDVTLIASAKAREQIRPQLPAGARTILARRSINYHEAGELFKIPAGTDVLLVNDAPETTYQTIALLQTLGIDHINYHPYSPGCEYCPRCKIAVTPGERQLVPDFVERVVDIHVRLIDITTIVEILLELDLLEEYAEFLSANYVRDIIGLIKDGVEVRRLEEMVRRKLKQEQKIARYSFAQIRGRSAAIRETLELARKMAASSATILIQGASGTGKELIAQGIHNASPRSSGPFVAVNFAALTETLLESELFGYADGAFTGAARGGAPGLFEEAHKGTLFLDEIGDAPLQFQVKLLRVLQEQQIRRVGSARIVPIDVRVVAATNRDLKKLIAEGKFREDLYYRIHVLPIRVPPLKERGEDALLLAAHFYGSDPRRSAKLSAEAYFSRVAQFFLRYDWPGNVRELQNTVEYLLHVSSDAPPEPRQLPEDIREAARVAKLPPPAALLRRAICNEIAAANSEGRPIGRRSLSECLRAPENQIREALEALRAEGRIALQRGRAGIKICAPYEDAEEASWLSSK